MHELDHRARIRVDGGKRQVLHLHTELGYSQCFHLRHVHGSQILLVLRDIGGDLTSGCQVPHQRLTDFQLEPTADRSLERVTDDSQVRIGTLVERLTQQLVSKNLVRRGRRKQLLCSVHRMLPACAMIGKYMSTSMPP